MAEFHQTSALAVEPAKSRETHAGKMARKATLRDQWHRARLGSGAKVRLNFSDKPKGKERFRRPRLSIWPAGKAAKPGRMMDGGSPAREQAPDVIRRRSGRLA
jgi:hypothetical protein